MRILLRKDTAAGLLFVAIGLAFCYAASTYRMGVLTSMGPGYFPFWLGILLTFLGACVFVTGIRAGESETARLDRWDLKSLTIIVGSIATGIWVLVIVFWVIAFASFTGSFGP